VSADAQRWIRPRRLARGDRVALVAPASAFTRDEFDAGVSELQTLGFEPVFDDRIFARSRFTAGEAALRAELLHEAWRDSAIAAVVAVRGGYGSAEMLPLLDSELMRRARKIFVGYSDTTALLWFHLQHGVTCFHGPMVEGRLAAGETGYHRESFLAALTSDRPVGALRPDGLHALRAGTAVGTLAGGTLTQLAASLGTPWAFAPPAGAVLFIEDVGERPYRIHRLFTQLDQAGVLSRASGLVLGEFRGCQEPGGDPAILDVVADIVSTFTGPVLFGFPSGHTTGPLWTLPFGVTARVSTDPPTLTIEEAAVSPS
jgi:muramoyltetrapeptide carboxypeptidase